MASLEEKIQALQNRLLAQREVTRNTGEHPHCAMGPEAEDILASFGLSDDESKECGDVMNKFDGYFVQRKTLFVNERSSTREFKRKPKWWISS